ncbi:glycosyl transferase [Nostoc carneum NIES-2107]|nr:glycosyl transferase [Nostoc carneum NIES-2107]
MEQKTLQSIEPKISIIILNWNGKEDTCECIRTVQTLEYSNYEVIVVDNGSQDDSVKTFRQEFPEVTIIETHANLGYAEGNNRGIAYAMSKGCDYILILNNDAIVAPCLIKSFLRVSKERPQAGVFGAKIYYKNEPNKIWFAGGVWIPETASTDHIGINQIEDNFTWSEIREIDYACGCALLVKTEVIHKIGFLEPKFFLTWEETDFCYRAKRAGFECLLVPSAHVWHKVSASFKGGEAGLLYHYFIQRNRLLWIERNLPFYEIIRIYFTVIIPEALSYIRAYISPRANSRIRMRIKVHVVAVIDYLFRRFGDCPSWLRSS